MVLRCLKGRRREEFNASSRDLRSALPPRECGLSHSPAEKSSSLSELEFSEADWAACFFGLDEVLCLTGNYVRAMQERSLKVPPPLHHVAAAVASRAAAADATAPAPPLSASA